MTWTGLFESALCNKEGEDAGRGRRALGFPLMSFWDIKSEVEPQSISPSVAIWLSSWMGRTMGPLGTDQNLRIDTLLLSR